MICLSVRLEKDFSISEDARVVYQIPESAMNLIRSTPAENIFILINKDSDIAVLYTDKEVTK